MLLVERHLRQRHLSNLYIHSSISIIKNLLPNMVGDFFVSYFSLTTIDYRGCIIFYTYYMISRNILLALLFVTTPFLSACTTTPNTPSSTSTSQNTYTDSPIVTTTTTSANQSSSTTKNSRRMNTRTSAS